MGVTANEPKGNNKVKKNRGWLRLVLKAGLAGVLLLGLWFGWVLSYGFSPGPLGGDGVLVSIPHNSGFYKIQRLLAAQGVIEPDRRFMLVARLFELTNKLKAGDYYFEPGQTPYRVLRILEEGRAIQLSITVPEGATMYQVADLLAAKELADREEFLTRCRAPELLKELGVEGDTVEGYLFPDTYRLTRGQSSDFLIRLMVGRMAEVLGELGVAAEKNKPEHMELFFSRHEVLTLASIVEKETAQGDERPLIARVFLNRLHRGMKLQTDPTVIYGLTDFDGNLRKKDLQAPTPYNTYQIRGLPPGPIGSPGRAAIAAVLRPAKESYLYFVSKNDGTHYFSKSLVEHNRAVDKYQKSRRYRNRRPAASSPDAQ